MPSIYKVFLKEVNRVDGKDVNINTFVGEKGEIFFDIDNNRLRVSDGSTPGGVDLQSNPIGINTTGDSHFTNMNISGSTVVGDLHAGIGTFTGNVSIAGTLTYEDVVNVDSVGLITARSGIEATGIVTARVGTALTYYGDGSQLDGTGSDGVSFFYASFN
jgi:hypothetical protein